MALRGCMGNRANVALHSRTSDHEVVPCHYLIRRNFVTSVCSKKMSNVFSYFVFAIFIKGGVDKRWNLPVSNVCVTYPATYLKLRLIASCMSDATPSSNIATSYTNTCAST